MLEHKTIRAEIWPVIPDDAGLWLASGDQPWLTGPVPADSTEQFEVEMELWGHGTDKDLLAALHSTSWRDGTWSTHTWIACLRPVPAAREWWPDACPVTAELAAEAGPPATHGAAEAPDVREWDVLLHGLGHIKDRWERDAGIRAALGPVWRQRLEPFTETLAGMYSRPHVPA